MIPANITRVRKGRNMVGTKTTSKAGSIIIQEEFPPRKKLQEDLLVITAGGSIDSHFDAELEKLVLNQRSVLPHMIETLKVSMDLDIRVKYVEICMKDSRQITADDRENIYIAIIGSNIERVLISHGNYTIPNTAGYLQRRFEEQHKQDQTSSSRDNRRIVLFGANKPIDIVGSDAPFQLGFAFASVMAAHAGIYYTKAGILYNSDGNQHLQLNYDQTIYTQRNRVKMKHEM